MMTAVAARGPAGVPITRHRLENQIAGKELSGSKLKGHVKVSFWREDFTTQEIQHVLDKLKPLREISEDGTRVTLKDIGNSNRLVAFLVSAVGFDVRTDTLKFLIVRSTLHSPDLNADFTEEDFRGVAYRLRNKYQDEDIRPYKVVFPLWNIPSFLAGVRKSGDVTINFSPSPQTSLFKTITRTRGGQSARRHHEEFFTEKRASELRECSTCIVHVTANSPADAHERASEALYEILGLINIAKDSGKFWRISSRAGGQLPVSDVLIGPHTTTHFKDGSLAYEGFWYENWEGGPFRRQLGEEMLKIWEANYTDLVHGVAKSPWSELCRSAAVRYFKAFSNPNLGESFLDGWRLFENISGPRDDKIEEKLTRVSNAFEDDIEHRIIGKHLALRRNLITHGHPINTDDEETLAFQMLQFVQPYLTLFIMNPLSLATLKEFWEFLDLSASQFDRSVETQKLQRRLSLLDKASQFRGET